MIQPGQYRARSTGPQDVSFGVSASGNLQIAVVFEFIDEALAGQTIVWVGTFAPGKSTDITIQALENCGWTGDDPTKNIDGIDGNEVILVIENDTNDKGDIYPRVKWINRPGAGRIKFKRPAEGAELRAFGAEIRAATLARRAAQWTARPEQRQALPPAKKKTNTYDDADYGASPSTDDDFPF